MTSIIGHSGPHSHYRDPVDDNAKLRYTKTNPANPMHYFRKPDTTNDPKNNVTAISPSEVRLVANRRARRYIARVLADGSLRVTVPRFGCQAEALQFVKRIGPWVEEQRARRATRETPADWPPVSREWLARARRELVPRVGELAHQHGLRVLRVSIRQQRSRWGSCSRRGSISLNWRLAHAPPLVRDYVILHELMHLREMNHSKRFWAHVDAACPTRHEAEQWLHQHAHLLS